MYTKSRNCLVHFIFCSDTNIHQKQSKIILEEINLAESNPWCCVTLQAEQSTQLSLSNHLQSGLKSLSNYNTMQSQALSI